MTFRSASPRDLDNLKQILRTTSKVVFFCCFLVCLGVREGGNVYRIALTYVPGITFLSFFSLELFVFFFLFACGLLDVCCEFYSWGELPLLWAIYMNPKHEKCDLLKRFLCSLSGQ